MNSLDLRDLIGRAKPRYCERYSSLVELISTKGDKEFGNFATFGPYYQTYMYAFIIGYKLGPKPIERGEKMVDFAPLGSWQPNAIRDFVLMLLLNKIEEYSSYSLIDLEDASEEELEAFVSDLVKAMNAYANSGFDYLQKKFDGADSKIEFEDPFVFVNFLEEINASTSNLD